MPTYEIKAPNGRTYRIEGPAGATDAQVRAEVLRQFPEAGRVKKEKPTSFLQGAMEGVSQTVANQARLLAGGSRAGSANVGPFGAIGSELLRLGATAVQSLQAKQTREAPVRGSNAGRITGQIVGSAPTMAVPGGAVVQGMAGGVVMSDNINNPAEVAQNALLGAAAGKVGDLAARGAGKVAGAVSSRARKPVQETTRALAQRLGVRPTPATVGGPTARTMQLGLGNLPGSSGPVAAGVARETDDLAAAARATAESMGPVRTPQAAGQAVAKGARAYERASGAQASRLYNQRDELIGGKNAPVLLGNTVREIKDFASQFPNTPVLSSILEHPTVRKLANALPDGPEPQVTLSEATDALSHIRSALRNAANNNAVTGSVKSRVAKVEQAIERDVVQAAQASDAIAGRAADSGAEAAQAAADSFYANRARTLDKPLGKALDAFRTPEKVSAESVYREMVTDMSRTGGNMARLRSRWAALPKGARRTFSATALDDMGRATSGAQNEAGSEWSFNTFLTNYDKMAPEARKMIFGDAANQVDDIAKYAAKLREVDKSRNFSNTARSTLAGAYLTLVGTEVWNGDYTGAAKVAAALPAMALGGKAFMASPEGRAWVRNTMRALTKAGTPSAEAALQKLTQQLPILASRHPELRAEATALFNTIANDNLRIPVAASDGEGDIQGNEQQTLP